MLNFRKLKQDFSSMLLQEGKSLHDQKKVISAKILRLDEDTIRFHAKVMGGYENTYESEIEIDRFESDTIHSNCDCRYRFDCHHIAALVFYLEENLDAILVRYSKEKDLYKIKGFDKALLATISEAKSKEEKKKDKNLQKQITHEYIHSADILSSSLFFLPEEENKVTKSEIAFIFNPESIEKKHKFVDFTLALRIPSRSKPLNIPNIKNFLDAVRFEEKIKINSKYYYFKFSAFNEVEKEILKTLIASARFNENLNNERAQRVAKIDMPTFGDLLSKIHAIEMKNNTSRSLSDLSEDLPVLPSIFCLNLENPLSYSFSSAFVRFDLKYLEPPTTKILLNPSFVVDQNVIDIKEVSIFDCAKPALLYQGIYYKFPNHIKREHLKSLDQIRNMAIPEPLFGTFVENTLPELKRFAEVSSLDVIEKFVTLPFASNIKARCELSYLDGELEATLHFIYDGIEVKASSNQLDYDSISKFITNEGILARDLVKEREIINDLFTDFLFNPEIGTYISKSEKKIVEFMTEIIPNNQKVVEFECPQNLLDQFIYDQTKFNLELDVSKNAGFYIADLKVDGELLGVKLDLLWECVAVGRAFIELSHIKKHSSNSRFSKILVLDLEKLSKIVQIFDEIGLKKLTNHKEDRPFWSLAGIENSVFENLPIKFKMSDKLKKLRDQMVSENISKPSDIPANIKANLRKYQKEGIHWLEKIRRMHLNGILADDMGLGKTLQAIVAIVQTQSNQAAPSIVVCPTSLLYNWQEEINKFSPKTNAIVIDGIPNQRKKIISSVKENDIIITSYTLIQKDIDLYKEKTFSYAILDEAQHIKNRQTRNAKSVKLLNATHKMILTGTPIENSLNELWSLLDFLMPGFLSSYDRFIEKYIRTTGKTHVKNIEYLKRKVSPFILRRMKEDVLKELPPVTEILYHCKLTETQLELYKSYSQSARDELTKLVRRDGFEKVQIHVLATLTRLKQICCHPAIFAKEKKEVGDSAKYEMLLELVQNLIDANHKTVIFSQYTKMLAIMRDDFEQRGIKFSYLDGTTKNRLQVVKEFNENKEKTIFLVSLKAGGTGLNITGADSVIHYDMWWNPAVESQATDRVHRIGQKNSVSSYKLVTVNTIEEKIIEMQNRKKGLVKKVISSDDEAISKLTWEEVLELLQT
ncbi:MAG: RNA polymerase-associated protein RapA [Candidatus Anoxychlamydiales bacterium]|nr:RNA polymerase-associated protein RapA [Candidatus Anoxychlamydiales bacterium]